jgi:hypothetical protein
MKCCRCKIEKELIEFVKSSRNKNGYSYRCKSCHKALFKDEQIAKKRQYRKNYVVSADKRKLATEKYNEKLRLSGKRKEYNRQWKINNADKVRASTRNRQAKIANAFPQWANSKEIAKFYTLAKAIEKYTGEKYHVDHIVPLRGKYVSGLHVPENLCILPASENLRKSNKWLT